MVEIEGAVGRQFYSPVRFYIAFAREPHRTRKILATRKKNKKNISSSR
jgi:hypothetical protein